MRNAFLALVLANVLLLAWQFWIDPVPLAPLATDSGRLQLFWEEKAQPPGATAAGPTGGPAPPSRPPAPGGCLRVGPLAGIVAAQQAAERLSAQGVDAVPIDRETQVWLGHWVQIGGFASVPAAEAARGRLVAGGLADAYLMQDGAQPMLSLGVFRDLSRADRVAGAARNLGFEVQVRDRYRPAVEQWLLIRPRPGQTLGPAELSLADDRILRTESATCEASAGSSPPVTDGAEVAEPQ